MRPVVLKLGGSAITNKAERCSPNLPVIRRSVEEIVKFRGPLILLHGGGSFAHPFVVEASLQDGYRDRSQLRAITETEMFLDQLTRILGAVLLSNNRPFVPLSPMSFMVLKNGQVSDSFLEPIDKALGLGLLPLVHGDIVFDRRRGCMVLSADRLASFLGKHFRAAKVLFGCDVDGVFARDPKSSPQQVLIEEVTKRNHTDLLRLLKEKQARDATGGMFSKIVEAVDLARNGVESVIFNMTRGRLLDKVLKGDDIRGTRFVPWKVND